MSNRWSICDKSKQVKEHIGFHYLLTKILLFTFILMEFNIFLKHCERIQRFREMAYLKHLYRNEFDKGTISDKVLKERAYEIAKTSRYDGY